MKNLLCFLIPVFTFGAIIHDLGKSHHSFTYSAPSSVIDRSDSQRAAATHHLTGDH